MIKMVVPPRFDHLEGEERQRSFASWKLDLLDAIAIDPRLNPLDVRIALLILQCMNGITGQCNPTLETIAERANTTDRSVRAACARLRAAGWLTWKRGNRQRPNRYVFDDRNVSHMLDRRTSMDDARKEARAQRRRLSTGTVLPVGGALTGSTLPLPTGTLLPVPTGSTLPPNTLKEEHLKGRTPESCLGMEQGSHLRVAR